MKSLKVLAMAGLMSASILARAEEASLVECRNQDKILVEYASATEEYLRDQAFTKLALSTTGNNDVPVILLDVTNLEKLPVQFQNFVVLHECAHHELGHISIERLIDEMTLRKADKDRELIADCASVKRLATDPTYNYGESDIQVIMDVMKAEFEKTSVKKDFQGHVIKKGIFKYYMPIAERNAALLKCFQDAKASVNPSPVIKAGN